MLYECRNHLRGFNRCCYLARAYQLILVWSEYMYPSLNNKRIVMIHKQIDPVTAADLAADTITSTKIASI